MSEFADDGDALAINHLEIARARVIRRSKMIGERFLSADGPYFYLNTFPCRPLRDGETWDVPERANSLFIGAQMRHYVDDDGTPGLEIIARCDKSRMPSRYYNNNRPWLQIEFGDYHVPACGKGERWIGDRDINHTFAVLQVINNSHIQYSYRDTLSAVRKSIERMKVEIERFERDATTPPHMLANARSFLADFQRQEADLIQRVMVEAAVRMGRDDCDVW